MKRVMQWRGGLALATSTSRSRSFQTQTLSNRPRAPQQQNAQSSANAGSTSPLFIVAAMTLGSMGWTSFMSDGKWNITDRSSLLLPCACEGQDSNKNFEGSSSSSLPPSSLIPLSAAGVKEQDIDELVRELLKDPNVNIPMLPDAIEAQLYKVCCD